MKNTYLTTILCLGLSTSLLTGCNSALTKNSQANASRVPLNSEVEAQLIAAAHSVESSLSILARNQDDHTVSLLNTTPLITPEGGMSGTADIDWTGPIEPLLRKLADMTDYKLKVLGNSPTIPIIVSIFENK